MLVRDIEKVLSQSEQEGWGYGGMALSKRSLVHLCRRIDEKRAVYRILELGGGQSTLFWQALSSLGSLSIEVITLEHNKSWANQLSKKLGQSENITVYSQTLKQISDQVWNEIFSKPLEASEIWESYGTAVPEDQYNLYTIRNVFYGEVDQLSLRDKSIDVMILDGPHGNGRSLAFPIFYTVLKPDALVLIDDFDHYPFLNDLGQVFQYKEVYREIMGEKRWVLVQLQERKY